MTTRDVDWLAFDRVKLYEDLLQQFRDGVRQEHVMLPTVVRTAFSTAAGPLCLHINDSAAPAEHGSDQVIVLDLGGTWLRAYLLSSPPQGDGCIEASSAWHVPLDRRCGAAEAYFDWIVARAASFLDSAAHPPRGHGRSVRVAVAFSYPMIQADMSDGLIMQMGKGYDLDFPDCRPASGACATATGGATKLPASGRSFRRLFDEAAFRLNKAVRLAAVVNDTFAPLLAGSESRAIREHHSGVHGGPSPLALVLGTGVNCSLIASTDLINDFAASDDSQATRNDTATDDRTVRRDKLGPATGQASAGPIAVNVELSLFGGAILPWTPVDRAIDAGSANPGFQTLEQFVAVRHMVDLVNRSTAQSITSGRKLTVEDFVQLLDQPRQHLQAEGDDSTFDAQTVQTVHDVARRSARMVACALTALNELAEVPDAARSPAVVSDACFPDGGRGKAVSNASCPDGDCEETNERREAGGQDVIVACTGTLLTGAHAYRSLCQAELDDLRQELNRCTLDHAFTNADGDDYDTSAGDDNDDSTKQAVNRRGTTDRAKRRIVLQVVSTEAQVRGLARLIS